MMTALSPPCCWRFTRRDSSVAVAYCLEPGTINEAELVTMVADHMTTITSCPTCHGLQFSVDRDLFPLWKGEGSVIDNEVCLFVECFGVCEEQNQHPPPPPTADTSSQFSPPARQALHVINNFSAFIPAEGAFSTQTESSFIPGITTHQYQTNDLAGTLADIGPSQYPLHSIDNSALPPAHLASNVVDELALRDENGQEVSEEEFLNRLDDPAAVQSALKALQDNSDASILKNKEIQEAELKKKADLAAAAIENRKKLAFQQFQAQRAEILKTLKS